MVIERIENYREKAYGGGRFGGKKAEKDNLRGKIILLVSLCAFAFLVVLAFFSRDGILEVTSFRNKIAVLSEKIKEVESQNAKLSSEIELLKKDYRYIEKIAREELGMARAGELIYLFPQQPQK